MKKIIAKSSITLAICLTVSYLLGIKMLWLSIILFFIFGILLGLAIHRDVEELEHEAKLRDIERQEELLIARNRLEELKKLL